MSFSFVFQTLGTATVTFRGGKTRAFENGRGPGESLDLLHCRGSEMPLCIHYRTTNNGKGHDSLKACYSESLSLCDLRLGVSEKHTDPLYVVFFPSSPASSPSLLFVSNRKNCNFFYLPSAGLFTRKSFIHVIQVGLMLITFDQNSMTEHTTLSLSLSVSFSLTHTHTNTHTHTHTH